MRISMYPVLFAALLVACWPVWPWYLTATLDGSNDYAGLLAAATVGLVAWYSGETKQMPTARGLCLPALALIGFGIASLAGVPNALRATLAGLAIAAMLSSWRFGTMLYLPLLALCLLALPLAASIQFYLGYPLRVLAGNFSVLLLQMNGLHVVLEGTLLNWQGQLIAIDAPCSGVKMMWSSMYLSYTLAALSRLSSLRTMLVMLFTVFAVVCANGLRAAALFYTETGIVALPDWAHSAIGVVCFTLALGAIVYAMGQAKHWQMRSYA